MRWFFNLFRRRKLESQLDSELRFHIEEQIHDLMTRGITEKEARRQVLRQFGGMQAVKEECRDARGTALLESALQDIRHGLRTLRKSPAFALTAVGTLALGIGANTAIFQLLDTVRLRNLPVPDPQRLALIQVRNGGGRGISHHSYNLTYPLWEQIRQHQQVFSGVFAWDSDTFRIGETVQPRHARVLLASGELFSILQVPPAAGRLFDRADDQFGCAAPGIILSYPFWMAEFSGRKSVIGTRFKVMDHPLEVIGVTPASFSGLEVGKTFDVSLPICAQALLHAGNQHFARRDVWWLTVMGRLKPGITLRQASDHVYAISPDLFEATVPTGYSVESLQDHKKLRLEALPAGTGISGLRTQYDTSLWLLLGTTGLVLLMACANLANLMLARASARDREFAVRLALGASRGRLIRHVLCESLLLALAGAALGLGLARVLSRAIVDFLTTEGDPLYLELSTDWRMLAFTAAVAIAACVVIGLASALRSSQTEPGEAIKAGGRGMTADRGRFSFQRLLVIVQISVSLVLVVGALLFVRSFRNLATLDPGFQEKGILLAFFDPAGVHVPAGAVKRFDRELLDEVRSVPQVQAAATTTNILIGGGMWSLGVRLGSVESESRFTWVSPGYFETLQIPLLAGRDFNASDTESSPKVAIVNQTFVRHFLGGADAIGKTFRTSAEPNYPEAEYQIIGVTKDTKYFDLREQTPPMSYAPADQLYAKGPSSITVMFIRASAPLSIVGSGIQHRLTTSHSGIAMEFYGFQQQIEEGLIRERLMAALSGFFGALAAILATIGLYGVIAYIVVRRRNEIGIRMALGATRGQVVGLVLRETVILVAIGVSIGVVCSLALVRTTSSLLFGLKASDPLTFFAAVVLLAAVAALGSYLPARRASRLDPMQALRYD